MISKKMSGLFRILLMAVFVAPCLSTAAFAASYYVATSGYDNNAGTLSSPFKTIQKGIDVFSRETPVLSGVVPTVGDWY